ncbi:tetratricopeptide repeat protein [Streptomyces sp. NPDC054844]
MREELLAALEQRMRVAERDSDAAGLLEPGAVDEAARLSQAVTVPENDLEVCQVLARFHVLREQVLAARSPRAAAAELPAAIRFLTAVYLHDPELVPDSAGRRNIARALDWLREHTAPDRMEHRQDVVGRVVELVAYPDRSPPADGGWGRIGWLRREREKGAATPEQLVELAMLLTDCPRYGEALDLLTEAVACLEQLPLVDRLRHPGVLLNALNARALRLVELGRFDDGVEDARRAVRIASALVAQNPLTEQARLARAQHFLAKYLDAAGRPSEALEWLDEAVPAYERLAAADPEHGGSLADVRKDWARALRTVGRAGDALRPAARAVTGFRAAADVNPQVFTRHVAFALEEHGACLTAAGRDDEAVSLMVEAVRIFRGIVAEDAAVAGNRADLARLLSHLGVCLTGAGRHIEAREACAESVARYEELAGRDPVANRAGLVDALEYLSDGHGAAGQWDEARAVSGRAVVLAREAAAGGGLSDVSSLARALVRWSGRLADVDALEEAERAAREAVGLWQSCSDTDPAYGAGLADALVELAKWQRSLVRGEEAVATAERAVALRRARARRHASSRRGPLAAALRVLGESRAAAGRDAEAILPLRQSVALYRALARLDPLYARDLVRSQLVTAEQLACTVRHTEALALAAECVEGARALPDVAGGRALLADALGAHATVLSVAARPTEAVGSAEESASLLRELAAESAGGHLGAELGGALVRLSKCLLWAGRPSEALASAEEARSALMARAERLGGTGGPSDRFASLLAGCLTQMSWCLEACGDASAADGCSAEAVGVYRGLARRLPAAYEPEVAQVLMLRAHVLSQVRRHEAALEAATEATALARRAAGRDRLVHALLLAHALRGEAAVLSAGYRRDEAVARADGAVEICRLLVTRHSTECRGELAAALTGAAMVLMDAWRYDDGIARAKEAVALRRELTRGQPGLFRTDLARDLGTLASLLNAAGRP